MRNFEERYTAWLDGEMDERERAAFEVTLDENARREAAEWGRLRGLLRETIQPAAMPHADFVNSQVLATIRHEAKGDRKRAFSSPLGHWLPMRWLAAAGVVLLATAAGVSLLVAPRQDGGAPGGRDAVMLAASPKLGAVAFAVPGGRGTVLWVSDAGYIPANEGLK